MDAERKIARELSEKMAIDRTPECQPAGTYPAAKAKRPRNRRVFDTAMPADDHAHCIAHLCWHGRR